MILANYLKYIFVFYIFFIFPFFLSAQMVNSCDFKTVINSWYDYLESNQDSIVTVSSNGTHLSYRNDSKRWSLIKKNEIIPKMIKITKVSKSSKKTINPPPMSEIDSCITQSIRDILSKTGTKNVFSVSAVNKSSGVSSVNFVSRDDSVSPEAILQARKKVQDHINSKKARTVFLGCLNSKSDTYYKKILNSNVSVKINDRTVSFKVPSLVKSEKTTSYNETVCSNLSDTGVWETSFPCSDSIAEVSSKKLTSAFYVSDKDLIKYLISKGNNSDIARIRICGKTKEKNGKLFFEICSSYTTFEIMSNPVQCKIK